MADFAAAQERIRARRAAREAEIHSVQSQLAQDRAERFAALPSSLRVYVQQFLSAWDVVHSPGGTRPAFRVGQVDAELLDEELLSLLKNQAGEGLKLFGASLKEDWSNEISCALRAALWKLSIWDHGASYGASLQGLKYVDARRSNHESEGAGTQAEATALQRAAYGLLTVGGTYAWTRWEGHLSNLENGYQEPSPLVKRLSRLTTLLSTTHNVAALFSFLVFLYDGRYRTLTDRILRLRLVPSSNQTSREVSFEFLNRQLVWHAFTEFLLFLLPLVGITRWRRWLARAWKKATSLSMSIWNGKDEGDMTEEDSRKSGELSFLPERTCAICYRNQNPTGGQSEQDVISASANAGIIGNASTDITNPYEAIPCACIYCYVCLAQCIEAEEGEGWICLRCGDLVKECKPWNGDVEIAVAEHEGHRRGSRKSIAWADEVVEKEFEEEEPMAAVEPRPIVEIPDE